MRNRTVRILVVLALVAVISAAGMSLFAAPSPKKGGFRACPVPPCMAPCILGAEPDLICKTPDGDTFKSTWGCCCCGGGGNYYKPLKK